MKGRPPDPQREKRGTGHRPLPGQKPAVEIAGPQMGLPEPPPTLPMSGHALWREVCEELAPRGLRPAHLPLIEMLVTAIVRNREARAKLAEGSAVLVWGDKDNPRFATNPWVKIEKDTAATYLRLAETLGLTPAALARLGLMQVAGQSILVTIAREVAKFAETDEDLDY